MFGFQPIAFNGQGSGSSCSPIDFSNAGFRSFGQLYTGTTYSLDFNIFNDGSLATDWTVDYIPDGMSFDTSTGIMSGTPTTAGSYIVNFSATNDCTVGYATEYTTLDIA